MSGNGVYREGGGDSSEGLRRYISTHKDSPGSERSGLIKQVGKSTVARTEVDQSKHPQSLLPITDSWRCFPRHVGKMI